MYFSVKMTLEAENLPIAPQGPEPSPGSPKFSRTLSSQLELSSANPVVNGMRQSTITFRTQRAGVLMKSVGIGNENISSVMVPKFLIL